MDDITFKNYKDHLNSVHGWLCTRCKQEVDSVIYVECTYDDIVQYRTWLCNRCWNEKMLEMIENADE